MEVGANHQQHGPVIPHVIQPVMKDQVVVVFQDVIQHIGYLDNMIHATML